MTFHLPLLPPQKRLIKAEMVPELKCLKNILASRRTPRDGAGTEMHSAVVSLCVFVSPDRSGP